MKKTNAVALLIIAIIIIIFGGGLYWAQKTGRVSLWAAFDGWSDVVPSDPSYEEIMAVGKEGWMVGYEDGLFRPDWSAERGQIVVVGVRARGDTLVDTSSCSLADPATWVFSDVSCDHAAYDYIATAKEAEIISGYPDGTFRPDNNATRAELVMLIVKAKEWNIDSPGTCVPGDPSTYPFPDVPCDHPAYSYIAVAKENRIIFGYETGEFRPDQDSTRRDLAVILYRAFIQAGEEINITGTVVSAQTGSVIPGATVAMIGSALEGTVLSDSTDSTGAYQLRIVKAGGSSTIGASASNYQSQIQGIILDDDKVVNFSLTPVSDPDSEGVISGVVRDADTGSAISGAGVVVLNYESGSKLTDTTDTQGNYTLRVGSTTGTFSVKASATGYNSKTLSTTIVGGAATLNFALSRIAADQPSEPGRTPVIIDGTTGGTVAAATGAVLPVALVLLGTILALFSLIYLLKTNKSGEVPQA